MAISKAYFISAAYIKEITTINQNCDDKKLLTVLLAAQDMYIEPLLGSDLYNAIISKIINSTLSGNYETLVNDKIAPCLAYFTYYEFLVDNEYSVARGGNFKNNSANAQNTSTEELTFLSQKQLDRAEKYMKRLTDYLCANSTLFPEYSTNSDDDVRPIRPNTFHGIDLDINFGQTEYERRTGQRY